MRLKGLVGSCPKGLSGILARATPFFWWCRCRTQRRDDLFKVCPEWKALRKILWAEVRKESGSGNGRFKIREHLTDEMCSQAVLDFFSTTDVGGLCSAGQGRRRE